jgi:hypothetical protein
VWVVDAKNPDSVLNPQEHNATQFLDQRMLIRRIEVNGINIQILLRRIRGKMD